MKHKRWLGSSGISWTICKSSAPCSREITTPAPHSIFWATIRKTVRPMLSDHCMSCLVCNFGVLWPNGWMDQDETWHAGRPRAWPDCVRWGPSSPPSKGHSPRFSAYICCGQMAGWIKMPLGMEVGLDPSNIVLDGEGAPLPKKGHNANFPSMSIVAKRLDRAKCHLVWR